MLDQITLSQAIDGYNLNAHARRLSQNTINDYANTFRKFSAFLGQDPFVDEITHRQIEQFLSSFPHLKKKTILNYHIALSSMWTWLANEEFVSENIVQRITPPRPEKVEIKPLVEDELQRLLYACDYTRAYKRRNNYQRIRHSRDTRLRDRAIIFLLLDTGIRASELADAKIKDIDLKAGSLFVHVKGAKQRFVYFSQAAAKPTWRYLTTRPEATDNSPLIVSRYNTAIDRDRLGKLLHRLGDRAKVKKVHPHRFRHTFAINFLRNGGNVFTLQKLLGHSTLDMCKRYLALAEQDLAANHQVASPAANMALK